MAPKALFDVSWNGRVNLVTGKAYAPYAPNGGHNDPLECLLRFVGSDLAGPLHFQGKALFGGDGSRPGGPIPAHGEGAHDIGQVTQPVVGGVAALLVGEDDMLY